MSERFDVAVLGLGPAGRALAHRLVAQGARVLAVDPAPERRWTQTLGGWAGQLPDWLDPSVVATRSPVTLLRTADTARTLFDDYAVLDNDRLQQVLTLDGATVLAEACDPEHLRDRADVVVDCRGSRPVDAGAASGAGDADATGEVGSEGSDPGSAADVPRQTAHGVLLDGAHAERVLGGADAVLMDWTTPEGGAHWGRRRPSFCYVIPVPGGRTLVEETCLAGMPALDTALLRWRLSVRLRRHGIPAHVMARASTEEVSIPLVASPRPGDLPAFGAAAHQLNPISGYSVFASLQQADAAARHLREHGSVPAPPRGVSAVRAQALTALLHLSGDATVELFDAFSRLPADQQRAVLDPSSSSRDLLAALTRQAALMRPRHRAALVAATLHTGPLPTRTPHTGTACTETPSPGTPHTGTPLSDTGDGRSVRWLPGWPGRWRDGRRERARAD